MWPQYYFTVFTFGDGDLIAQILRGVALLTNHRIMTGLLKVTALFGGAMALVMWAVDPAAWRRLIAWLLGLVIVFAGAISFRTTVIVEDVVDSRIAPGMVDNVPFLVSFPAYVSSQIAFGVMRRVTALQLNGELGNGMTYLAPTTNLQLILGANLYPGDLRANIINYLNWCVAPPNSLLVHPAGRIQNDPDLFGMLESRDQAQMLPTVLNGEIVGSLSCRDHYYTILAPILRPLNPDSDAGLRRTVDELKCQIFAGRRLVGGAGCVDDASFWMSIDSAMTALGLTATNGRDLFVVSLLAKLLPEGEMDYAKRIMNQATAIQIANDGLIKQLEIQTKAGADAVKNGLVRQVRALADGTVLLSAPVLLALSVTPLVWTMLGVYARLFAWLALWGPIQAVTHYVATTMAASDISGLTMMSGITASNLHQIFMRAVQTNAIGYDMLLAVPAISLAMAWGGIGALGSLLQSAGTRYAQTGQDVWRRVESGESVLASSMSRGQLLSGSLMRPPNMPAFSNAALANAWSSSAVTHGVGGATILPGDGRTITTTRDGSTRIQSPTEDISMTSQGHKTGWQVLDREQIVDGHTISKGASVRWTGHGAEVNLPSETDPVTGQTVAPVGRFAQDPAAPGGFGALVSKDWTVTQGGLTHHATQGADGKIAYRIQGATDMTVFGRNGQMRPVVAQIDMMQAYQPDGDGRYVSSGDPFGRATYKDEQGNWVEESGTMRNGHFTPLAGASSNQLTNRSTMPLSLPTPDGKSVSGTANVETVTGPDGASKGTARVSFANGLTWDIISQGGQTFATVSGVMRGVRLMGGGAPDAQVDLPINNVQVAMNLPDPSQWNEQTLAKAIREGQVQPFKTQVVDPVDPRKVAEVEMTTATFWGSPGGNVEGAGSTDQPPHGPTASVGKYESATTAGEVLAPGATGMPGRFVVKGEMDQWGDMKHSRVALIEYLTPEGRSVPLGAGEVSARRNEQTGQWEVASLKAAAGQNLAQENVLQGRVTETIRGVSALREFTVDPQTGQTISSRVTIGVTEQNLEQIQRAFRSGPVTFQPGGTITIANDGRVSYEGPATMRVQGDAAGEPFKAQVAGQAALQGTYDPKTGTTHFQAGKVSGTILSEASSKQLPGAVQQFFKEQLGQDGVVSIVGDPSGQALRIESKGGDTMKAERNVRSLQSDTNAIEQGTFKLDPQTAFNAALRGDRRVLAEPIFLEREPTVRYTRAAAVATALANELGKRIQWQGISQGTSSVQAGVSGGVAVDTKDLIEKLAGKLPKSIQEKVRKLSAVSPSGQASGQASGQLEHRWTETDITDLYYNRLMEIYDESVAAGKKDPGRAILHYTTEVGALVRETEDQVRKNTPSTYGTDAPFGAPAQGARNLTNAAAQAAGKIVRSIVSGRSADTSDATPARKERPNAP